MLSSPENVHPYHPHHLECPRCHKHTVIIQGENRYECLSCGWWKDVGESYYFYFPLPVLLFILAFALVMFLP